MARTRKVVTKQNLDTVPVFIDDTRSYSEYFTLSQFDRYFTSGKNSFLIGGTSFLRPRSEILLELIDSNGDPVFLNPVTNYSEGGARLVSVEVYEDIPSGPGTLTILGIAESTADGRRVPAQWVNQYNIRWKIPVAIEPSRKNVSIIRFKRAPEIVAEEQIGAKYIVERQVVTLPNIQLPIQTQLKNSVATGYIFTPTASVFTRDMLDGTVSGSITRLQTIQTISASVSTYQYTALTSSVQLPIDRILSTTRGFTNTNLYDQTNTLFPVSILEDGVTNTTESVVTSSVDMYAVYTTSTSQSNMHIKYTVDNKTAVPGISNVFADLRIINLNTLSGEVARIKTFVKEPQAQGDYYLVADTQPEAQTFFVSGGVVDTGTFTTESLAANVWFSDFSGSSTYFSGSTSTIIPLITGDTVRLLDGVTFDIVTPASTGSYFLGTQEPLLFFTGSEYTLQFDVAYARESASGAYTGQGGISTYLYGTGSARNINTVPLGQLLDTISFAGSNVALREQREVNFTVKQSGYAYLRFLMTEGFFTYANIKLTTAEEFGFNSDEVRMVIPLDAYASSSLIFKTEFYDINNNGVGIDTISAPLFISPTGAGGFGSASFATSASYTPGIATVSFVVNGGISPVTTGYKGSVRMPTNVLLSNVALYTSGSGSVNVDITRQVHSSFDPVLAAPTSIVGTALSMSNDTKYLDTVLSGWTTTLNTDDVLNFFFKEVDGTELKLVTVVFNIQR